MVLYSVGLYTLGCKVSQYETEAVAERFEERGARILPFDNVCDVYVINTCTVTAESDRKCRQIIRRAIKKNPLSKVLVMGCYSQRAPSEIAKIPGVSAVIGTENKLSLVDIAERMLFGDMGESDMPTVSVTDLSRARFEPMRVKGAPRTRAYVKIEDGCESKCTYCAISGARGKVRSKLPSDVIAEVEELYRRCTREVVLTGIETGSYGRDFEEKYTLADLLCELDRRHCCERVRLGSLAPELINEEFVERVKDLSILAPHFHLSMQSGSDAVLRAMKRRYNSKMAMAVIENIRKNIPRATFTTDLMVGFPGESDADFLDTVDFLRRARFLDAHVFAYSRREGTPAAYYDSQIPEEVKRERSERLIREKNAVRDSVLSEILASGERLSCIAESSLEDGTFSAHSDTYVELRISGAVRDIGGEMVTVRPVSHKCGIMYAEILEEYK